MLSLVQLQVTLNYVAGVKPKRLIIVIFRVSILKSNMAAILLEFQVAPNRKKMVKRIICHCAKFGAFSTKQFLLKSLLCRCTILVGVFFINSLCPHSFVEINFCGEPT